VIIIGVDEQSGGKMGGVVVAAVVMPRGRQCGEEQGIGEGNIDDCGRGGRVVVEG
jgi:hypothetical protein